MNRLLVDGTHSLASEPSLDVTSCDALKALSITTLADEKDGDLVVVVKEHARGAFVAGVTAVGGDVVVFHVFYLNTSGLNFALVRS